MNSNSYTTMASMMGQGSSGATASVPTQTFNAANILGTPVPMVGDNRARPNYSSGIGGTNPSHLVIVAVAVFVIGYLAFHINFEK
jgi:hypothetical protein